MEVLEAVLEARRLLECVTPLKTDCGRACGGACCQPDEDGQGGMLLFPGEEALYADLPEGFSPAAHRNGGQNGSARLGGVPADGIREARAESRFCGSSERSGPSALRLPGARGVFGRDTRL